MFVISARTENRVAFWGLNLLLLGALLRDQISLLAVVVFVAGMALILCMTVVWKRETEGPACTDLPLFLFLDVLLCIGVRWAKEGMAFSLEAIGAVLDASRIGLLVAAAAIATLTSMAPRKFRAVSWLGGLATGMIVVRELWGNGYGARLVGGLYMLLSCLWVLFTWLSEQSAREQRAEELAVRNNWLGRLLFVLFLAVNVVGLPYLQSVFRTWEKVFQALSGGLLNWWQTLLLLLLLVFAGAVMYDPNNEQSQADVYVPGIAAGVAVLALVLQMCYMPFQWYLLAAYVVMICVPMRRFAQGKTFFRQGRAGYLVWLTVLFALLTVILQYSLWVNLIVSIGAGMALYHLTGEKMKTKGGGLLWAVVLLAVCGECAGLLAAFRFQTENFAVLVLIAGMALAAMLVLSTAHPGSRKPENWLRGVICVAAAVLCVILTCRYGARVDVAFDMEKLQAEVTAEARGVDNEIVSVEYYWSSLLGNRKTRTEDLPASGTLDIDGARLIVVAVDRHGVQTTRTVWTGYWTRLWP